MKTAQIPIVVILNNVLTINVREKPNELFLNSTYFNPGLFCDLNLTTPTYANQQKLEQPAILINSALTGHSVYRMFLDLNYL